MRVSRAGSSSACSSSRCCAVTAGSAGYGRYSGHGGLLRGWASGPAAPGQGVSLRAGLPATELALHGPERGQAGQGRQAGHGGREAAGGMAGGPAQARGGEPPYQPGHDVQRPGAATGPPGRRRSRRLRPPRSGGRPRAAVMRCADVLAECHSARLTAGRYSRRYPSMNVSSGMTQATQAVTTIRVPRRRPGHTRVPAAPGDGASHDGGDAGEQVRHADQVGQDEVAVEADEREQLLQHLQVGEGDDQEQDLVARWPRRGRPGPA